jgi:hypothetical protein
MHRCPVHGGHHLQRPRPVHLRRRRPPRLAPRPTAAFCPARALLQRCAQPTPAPTRPSPRGMLAPMRRRCVSHWVASRLELDSPAFASTTVASSVGGITGMESSASATPMIAATGPARWATPCRPSTSVTDTPDERSASAMTSPSSTPAEPSHRKLASLHRTLTARDRSRCWQVAPMMPWSHRRQPDRASHSERRLCTLGSTVASSGALPRIMVLSSRRAGACAPTPRRSLLARMYVRCNRAEPISAFDVTLPGLVHTLLMRPTRARS